MAYLLLKAKIKAQMAMFEEIANEYGRLGKVEAYQTYMDIRIGLIRALEIIEAKVSEPIIGHDLLEELKARKEA